MQRKEDRDGLPLIDCDIHNAVPSLETLYPYLDDHWVDYGAFSKFRGPDASDYPGGSPIAARPDFKIKSEGLPGSRLEHVQNHVLDAWDTEVGILTCIYQASCVHNADLGVALATAVTTWQVEKWLEARGLPSLPLQLMVNSISRVKLVIFMSSRLARNLSFLL
jgi:hypothetical protein